MRAVRETTAARESARQSALVSLCLVAWAAIALAARQRRRGFPAAQRAASELAQHRLRTALKDSWCAWRAEAARERALRVAQRREAAVRRVRRERLQHEHEKASLRPRRRVVDTYSECFSYRDTGFCRFGERCRFWHPGDIVDEEGDLSVDSDGYYDDGFGPGGGSGCAYCVGSSDGGLEEEGRTVPPVNGVKEAAAGATPQEDPAVQEFFRPGSSVSPPLGVNQKLMWTPDDVSVEERRALLDIYKRRV